MHYNVSPELWTVHISLTFTLPKYMYKAHEGIRYGNMHDSVSQCVA